MKIPPATIVMKMDSLNNSFKPKGVRIIAPEEQGTIDLSELRTTRLNRKNWINALLRRRKIRFWHILQNSIGKYFFCNQL